MQPVLRSSQVLKQEAEEIGLEGKDIPEYVRRHQALDIEEGGWERCLEKASRHPDGEDTGRCRKEKKSR